MPDGSTGATSTQLDNNALAQDSNPASRLPPLSQAPLFDIKSDDLRELVLDYLTHSCFIDSALAFVKEWDQSDSVSSSNASFYSSSEAGPSAGPSSSAVTAAGRDGNPAASASSAAFAASAEQAQEDDEDDDQMMQSAYEELDGARVNTNGFHAENGDSAAYQDRHHHYPGNKYLSRDEVEQIRARKGGSETYLLICLPRLSHLYTCRDQASRTARCHPSCNRPMQPSLSFCTDNRAYIHIWDIFNKFTICSNSSWPTERYNYKGSSCRVLGFASKASPFDAHSSPHEFYKQSHFQERPFSTPSTLFIIANTALYRGRAISGSRSIWN